MGSGGFALSPSDAGLGPGISGGAELGCKLLTPLSDQLRRSPSLHPQM
jgi:hypothetical protein